MIPSICSTFDLLMVKLSEMCSLETLGVMWTLHVKTPSSASLIMGAILNVEVKK